MDILFFLILGHLAGDYALQTDHMAANKGKSITVLSLHVVVYVVTLWFFFLFYSVLYQPGLYIQGTTFLFLAVLYIQHWGQDYLKSRYKNCSKQMYYLDQILHLAVLYIYRIFIF
ncbi:MAG: DUF3307 domain-containing protein [candidate division Zixibacteria bacterium]|nr:DUF3307 domain-containing protein [candidate division Zixibacteria bacterium]